MPNLIVVSWVWSGPTLPQLASDWLPFAHVQWCHTQACCGRYVIFACTITISAACSEGHAPQAIVRRASQEGVEGQEPPLLRDEAPLQHSKVYAHLEAIVDALKYEDINLTRLRGHRLLDAASFDNLAQEHAAQGTPVMIEVKH